MVIAHVDLSLIVMCSFPKMACIKCAACIAHIKHVCLMSGFQDLYISMWVLNRNCCISILKMLLVMS